MNEISNIEDDSQTDSLQHVNDGQSCESGGVKEETSLQKVSSKTPSSGDNSVVLSVQVPVYGGMCIAKAESVVNTESLDENLGENLDKPKGLVEDKTILPKSSTVPSMLDNKRIFFVKGAIPGERVKAQIKERKKDYYVAEAVQIIDRSPHRTTPLCPVFEECGGCHYQHISYDQQLEIKKAVLEDCLSRIGRLDTTIPTPLTSNQWGYRTKVQLKFSPTGQIGFYREGSRDVVPIESCMLAVEPINRIIKAINNMPINSYLKGIKEIHILSGMNLIAYLMGDKISESTVDQFIEIGFDGVSTDKGLNKGAEYCIFEGKGVGDKSYRYTISPNSFYQTNWGLNQKLISMVMEGVEKDIDIIDVYGGAGNFAVPLSKQSANILIIEENHHSKADALRNIKVNKIKNVRYMSKSFESARIDHRFDFMILNPPRRGLTTVAVNQVLKNAPEKIAYISCNPSTFARDILKIAEMYQVQSVNLVDMFPNTYHCEVIGMFQRR